MTTAALASLAPALLWLQKACTLLASRAASLLVHETAHAMAALLLG